MSNDPNADSTPDSNESAAETHPDPDGQPIPIDDLPPDPFGDGDPFDTASVEPSQEHRSAADSTSDPFASFGPAGLAGAGFSGLGSMFGPMLGDLAKLLGQQSQNGWSQAKSFAALRAAGDPVGGVGGASTTPSNASSPLSDPPVDPLDRIRLEELVGIVERHVATYTGLELATTGLAVVAHTRAAWATDFLDTHRALLEPALGQNPSHQGETTNSPDAILANLLNLVGPSMMAMQIGAMAGQLAHRYFGSCDLPLPRQHADRIAFIPSNINRFADEWSLPPDSLRVRVAIDELLLHAIVRQPQVAQALQTQIRRHVSGFSIDAQSLMQRFANIAENPLAMQEELADLSHANARPASPEQRASALALQRMNAVISGYVGHVGAQIGSFLLGGDTRIDEALRRRRIVVDDATDTLASLTGLQINAEQHERGVAFVAGVLERTGDAGAAPLNALWTDDSGWPTDAEFEAPGLWLARIELSN
jgi:putative hydrolase